MKLSLFVGGAVGYVLGARAGHERYEAIVSVARRVVGSQTVQSTAGVLQAQVDAVTSRAKEAVSTTLHHSGDPAVRASAPNGHRS
jgi:uncharacterized protein YunC (DUF1805 family)